MLQSFSRTTFILISSITITGIGYVYWVNKSLDNPMYVLFLVQLFLCYLLYQAFNKNKQSEVDSLTGVYSKNFFQLIFPKVASQADRGNQEISLILTNIQGFREINNRFGASKGNLMLKNTAEILLEESRMSDIVCSIDRDKFLIILPQTQGNNIGKYTERLDKRTRLMSPFPVVMQYVLVSYPMDGKSADELLGEAYKRMKQCYS